MDHMGNIDSRPVVRQTWTVDTDRDEASAADWRADCASEALHELLGEHPDIDLSTIRMRVIDARPSTYTVEASGKVGQQERSA
jgi:hypothetical protein